jgi:Zn-dependent M28 family amino/carboxypeptidase
MELLYSHQFSPQVAHPATQDALTLVSEKELEAFVQQIAYPRHFLHNQSANEQAAKWLESQFLAWGYTVSVQGQWRNIIAVREGIEPTVLVGAHYDSVPETPGADDNGSAVAGMLMCAKVIAEVAPNTPVVFVAFNREEDGLLGSIDFVQNALPEWGWHLRVAHVLEMIGYTAPKQTTPLHFPFMLPTKGDFLGVLGNPSANTILHNLLTLACTYTPDLPVLGLSLPAGVEKVLPVLARSDHAPFWQAGIPALQWTDTAEFRNPHYHQITDTPDTLDYAYLSRITQLLLADVLNMEKVWIFD